MTAVFLVCSLLTAFPFLPPFGPQTQHKNDLDTHTWLWLLFYICIYLHTLRHHVPVISDFLTNEACRSILQIILK